MKNYMTKVVSASLLAAILAGCSNLQVNQSKTVAIPSNEIVAVIPLNTSS